VFALRYRASGAISVGEHRELEGRRGTASQRTSRLLWRGFCPCPCLRRGLHGGRQHLDVDGVDWQIGGGGPQGSVRSPRIEVQVKTWARAEEGNDHWTNRVDIKHFNALAGAGFMVPRFLVAVVRGDVKGATS
jgi:hypothetical protein